MTAKEWADQAMVFGGDRNPMIKRIEKAIEAAILEEREACAKIEDTIGGSWEIAEAIRKRGQA